MLKQASTVRPPRVLLNDYQRKSARGCWPAPLCPARSLQGAMMLTTEGAVDPSPWCGSGADLGLQEFMQGR